MPTDPGRRHFLVSAGVFAGFTGVALANNVPLLTPGHHVIMMLNAACSDDQNINVFEPPILHAATGDVVTFIPTDTGHNTAARRGMIPEGVEPWNGGVDEVVTLEMSVPGVYGYVCTPHYEVGMVGLIIVGNDLSNLDAARSVRQRDRARAAFRALFEEIDLS